jgi:pimeloyl-ACP methyl ester carboxylesterase
VRLVIGTATREGGISDAEIAVLQERLPHFSVDEVDAAGHFVFEEKPEAVVAAVKSVARDASVQRLAGRSSR